MYGSDQIAGNEIAYVGYSRPGRIVRYSAQPAYVYTAADYVAAFQALLPRGRVWPRTSDATMTAVVSGLVQVYARTNARANDLIAEAFPATTFQMLPEWESTLAIGTSPAGIQPTVQQRRAQVLARFCGIGGQSVPYLIAYAKNLGYLVTIDEYAPTRAGGLCAGDAIRGDDWACIWTVNASVSTLGEARAGQMGAGEPLTVWSNGLLQTELQKLVPAHTILQFNFS